MLLLASNLKFIIQFNENLVSRLKQIINEGKKKKTTHTPTPHTESRQRSSTASMKLFNDFIQTILIRGVGVPMERCWQWWGGGGKFESFLQVREITSDEDAEEEERGDR